MSCINPHNISHITVLLLYRPNQNLPCQALSAKTNARQLWYDHPHQETESDTLALMCK